MSEQLDSQGVGISVSSLSADGKRLFVLKSRDADLMSQHQPRSLVKQLQTCHEFSCEKLYMTIGQKLDRTA